MGLNPCLHIPPHSKFYVKNLVYNITRILRAKVFFTEKLGLWQEKQNTMPLINSQYFWKWTNANPMKKFSRLASHPKLLIGSKLSLGFRRSGQLFWSVNPLWISKDFFSHQYLGTPNFTNIILFVYFLEMQIVGTISKFVS